jgi:hypothetical protein
MVAYAPTNAIIITDTESSIQRLRGLLEAIDVENHEEKLAVIKVFYADAAILGEQISEIYDTQASSPRRSSSRRSSSTSNTASSAGNVPGRVAVRIITDDRTNSRILRCGGGTNLVHSILHQSLARLNHKTRHSVASATASIWWHESCHLELPPHTLAGSFANHN